MVLVVVVVVGPCSPTARGDVRHRVANIGLLILFEFATFLLVLLVMPLCFAVHIQEHPVYFFRAKHL